MHPPMSDTRLANLAAAIIHDGFNSYRSRFAAVTCRAKRRFESRDWQGMQADTGERLDLYKTVLGGVIEDLRRLLADRLGEPSLWGVMKSVFSSRLTAPGDRELGETFFNSVTRRIFNTVGVDAAVEFVTTEFENPPDPSPEPVYDVHRIAGPVAPVVQRVLAAADFSCPFQDLAADAERVAERICARIDEMGPAVRLLRLEVVRSVFYREMGAYLVGRLITDSGGVPLALALLNPPAGVTVDALLLSETAVSILFSFTRSYFHVAVPQPHAMVDFLRSILPFKPLAELYISLGFDKHGKTVLYRDLLANTTVCGQPFRISRGKRGLVMVVFDMPSYDVVFKLIRDRIAHPKETTRRKVIAAYDFVFKHDRAGRLLDAQSFEHLQFDHACFDGPLLAELAHSAARTVRIEADRVVVGHVYLERRVTPLDLYLQTAEPEAARAVVVDYGNAIKDLARINVFPGDLLLKNFGVTRHGRVVFYDYDELCPLLACNFRRKPPSRRYEDEMAAEPWFTVGEADVFPEEFRAYLGLPGPLEAEFMAHHADLFDVDFWLRTQARIRSGERIHIFPYPDVLRLERA
ncbi:MAG: bifunctional isocitrate dehydrogenase kinase/phosphatase [Desulfobacterales bacterium]|nr:bifunctional isocitrate dehydrogenase kinase/phosphatase [Desulfobacterales bacterium]